MHSPDPFAALRHMLAAHDTAYCAWCKHYCAAFEELADMACESEG